MFDEKLREEVVKILGMEDASEADQDEALAHIENIAKKRFARAIPDMFTDEQLNHIEAMRGDDERDEKIVAWVEQQLPDHEELQNAVILDVATEIAES